MSRIEGADLKKLGFFSRLFMHFAYSAARKKVGKITIPMTLSAHRPRLLLGVAFMELGLDKSRALDPAVKTLASVRASTLIGCPF